MSSPSTTRNYTAQHPPTQQAERQPDHGSQNPIAAPDPTTSSQQPRQWLNAHAQPPPDTSSKQDQILDAQSSSPFANTNSSQQGAQSTATIDKQPPSSPNVDLTTLTRTLKSSLRQYPDFPTAGILFEDILPLFSSPTLHKTLITALQSFIQTSFPSTSHPSTSTSQQQQFSPSHSSSIPNPDPQHDKNSSTTTTPPFDYILALESRGFLFGPTLALHFNAGFVPVRKPGKLPGAVEKAGFGKEYGEDGFEIQRDALEATTGKRVLVVDDILATGGSAAAAGQLVEKVGGTVVGYVFLLELEQLKGREKLNAPVRTLMGTMQEEKGT